MLMHCLFVTCHGTLACVCAGEAWWGANTHPSGAHICSAGAVGGCRIAAHGAAIPCPQAVVQGRREACVREPCVCEAVCKACVCEACVCERLLEGHCLHPG